MKNSSRPSKGRRYDPLTRSFATWLCQFIDRYDWGFLHRDGRPRHALDEHHLDLYLSKLFWPQKLTRTTIQKHLHGEEKLYTTSRRSSGFAFIRLDIDAHAGQTDALDTADWVRMNFFPEAYHEPSQRGHSIYLVLRVGFCRRALFNDHLDRVVTCLSELLVENNFESTIEIQGGFTLISRDDHGDHVIHGRGKLAAMPSLPNREADLERLISAPIYLLDSFSAVFDAAQMLHDTQASSAVETEGPPRISTRVLQSADAWEDMKRARFHFTTVYRRDPDQDELLSHYETLYDTDAGDAARSRRADYVLRYSTFDITAATHGGYEANRDRLLKIVDTIETVDHVGHQTIVPEDMAIYLYAVENRSFAVADHPRRQWTCSYDFVSKMFLSLKSVTGRGGANRNKLKAIRDILESKGLIECLDRGYVATGKTGICQKWVVGDQHPRYSEWVRFAAELDFEKIPIDGRIAPLLLSIPMTPLLAG